MSKALLSAKQPYCLSQYPKRWGWLYNPNYSEYSRGESRYRGLWWVTEHRVYNLYWNCPWAANDVQDVGYESIFYFGKVRRNRYDRHSRSCALHNH